MTTAAPLDTPETLTGLDPATVAEQLGADRPAAQQPTWPDSDALDSAVSTLRAMPPLVFAGECDDLRDRMAAASVGEAFVLQGGDCAETFVDATADNIRDRVKTVLQMSAVLTYGAGMPVVKMGRMAGQFAKPRSKDTETRDEVTLPAYRGDMVNDFDFTEASRTPDPHRLVDELQAHRLGHRRQRVLGRGVAGRAVVHGAEFGTDRSESRRGAGDHNGAALRIAQQCGQRRVDGEVDAVEHHADGVGERGDVAALVPRGGQDAGVGEHAEGEPHGEQRVGAPFELGRGGDVAQQREHREGERGQRRPPPGPGRAHQPPVTRSRSSQSRASAKASSEVSGSMLTSRPLAAG